MYIFVNLYTNKSEQQCCSFIIVMKCLFFLFKFKKCDNHTMNSLRLCRLKEIKEKNQKSDSENVIESTHAWTYFLLSNCHCCLMIFQKQVHFLVETV